MRISLDPMEDLVRWHASRGGSFPRGIVFDVGANIGQSVKWIRSGLLPDVEIWCFEPVQNTYRTLSENVRNDPNVRLFRIALSDQPGDGWMKTSAHSGNDHLAAKGNEQVLVATGDRVCVQYDVGLISLLKIDTEGHDLQVVAGFEQHIRRGLVDAVLLEASMHSGNRKHAALVDAIAMMEDFGFGLFGVYEQVTEPSRMVLRRSNLLFAKQ